MAKLILAKDHIALGILTVTGSSNKKITCKLCTIFRQSTDSDVAASACKGSNIIGYNILKSFHKDPQHLPKNHRVNSVACRNTFIQMVPTVNSKAVDIIELKEDYSESNLLQLLKRHLINDFL